MEDRSALTLSSTASTSFLKTSLQIYPPPMSPRVCKVNSDLKTERVRSPSRQLSSPLSPNRPSSFSRPFTPYEPARMPPQLVFESWWNEANHSRTHAHVVYNTQTRECLAGTRYSVALDVCMLDGQAIQEWDLHVGAQVRIAGKRVTLQQAGNLATQTWLDESAQRLLAVRRRLVEEVSKFRHVVDTQGQYAAPQRSERVETQTRAHVPAGGRVNLRRLIQQITDLTQVLRSHRCALPPIPGAILPADTLAHAPTHWNAHAKVAEERAQHDLQVELLRQSLAKPKAQPRSDFMQWLASIPLAASAAQVTGHDLTAHAAPTAKMAPSATLNRKLTLNMEVLNKSTKRTAEDSKIPFSLAAGTPAKSAPVVAGGEHLAPGPRRSQLTAPNARKSGGPAEGVQTAPSHVASGSRLQLARTSQSEELLKTVDEGDTADEQVHLGAIADDEDEEQEEDTRFEDEREEGEGLEEGDNQGSSSGAAPGDWTSENSPSLHTDRLDVATQGAGEESRPTTLAGDGGSTADTDGRHGPGPGEDQAAID